jgi:leader peptidase (prepilin peptidase)/N-methyltransferase
MLWLFFGVLLGMVCASVLVAGVFRTHEEWAWMRPGKACVVCEVPRRGADFLPIVGDMLLQGRCRNCRAATPWQYVLIEAAIVLLVVFHVWRYSQGVWIPDLGAYPVWAWALRDILFTLSFVVVFVYDAKFSLIMDTYMVPSVLMALLLNLSLGMKPWPLLAGMVVLGAFFALQHAFAGGRLMGGGDVRMGVLMGAMLGVGPAIAATLFAYVGAALFGAVLVLAHRRGTREAMPFGTWLAVMSFVFLVWGPQVLAWLPL